MSELVFLAVSLLLRLRLSIHWGLIGSSTESFGDSRDPLRMKRTSYQVDRFERNPTWLLIGHNFNLVHTNTHSYDLEVTCLDLLKADAIPCICMR